MSWHDKSEFLLMQCVNASWRLIIVVFWSDKFTVFAFCMPAQREDTGVLYVELFPVFTHFCIYR